MTKFSWVPAFEAISTWIVDYKDQQSKLLELLAVTGIENGLNDVNKNEETIPLAEIDPFTFYALFMKYGLARRQQLLHALLNRIKLDVAIPDDFEGVPSAQALKVWLFPYQKDRAPEMVETLWELFMQAREDSINPDTFEKALTIPGTGFAKLTECLFYAFPKRYLPVDGQTRPWLKRHGLAIPTDWRTYQQCLKDVGKKSSKPFYEISYDAYVENMNETFSAEKAIDYFGERYPGTLTKNTHLVSVRTPNGRELAFDPGKEGQYDKKRSIGLFIDADPTGTGIDVEIKHYAASKSRNSNLKSNAPTLSTGNEAYHAKIKDLATLESICNWYDGETTAAVQQHRSVNNEDDNMTATPLNTILYGPPGTGKTYTTTDMAVKLADPQWYEEQSESLTDEKFRTVLKHRYDELVTSERIVFTTFHQSFSYEDFIEGIRADTNDVTAGIEYRIEDGVFKRLCDSADKKVLRNEGLGELDMSKRQFWKMSLGNTQSDESEDIFNECIENNYVLLGWGGPIDFAGCGSLDEVKQRYLNNKPNEDRKFAFSAVNRFKNQIKNGDIIVVSAGNSRYQGIAEVVGDYEFLDDDERDWFFQSRKVRWLKVYEKPRPVSEIYNKIFSQQTIYNLSSKHLKFDVLTGLLADDNVVAESEPYVIIIDEINRGNISRIFGELITLLEPDKRKGGTDERSVTLPYSKKPFQVPQNVYVIGTMNTADRSLVQLDLALRRRFNFFNMPPKPELLKDISVHGIDMVDMLDIMNQRIEVLLDRDHLLGHAYLFPLKNISGEEERAQCLGDIFKNNIIPLLQEYFFDDWERIRWVLNDHRKQNKDDQFITQGGSSNLQQLFGNDIQDSLSERRFKINEGALYIPAAYQQIISGSGS